MSYLIILDSHIHLGTTAIAVEVVHSSVEVVASSFAEVAAGSSTMVATGSSTMVAADSFTEEVEHSSTVVEATGSSAVVVADYTVAIALVAVGSIIAAALVVALVVPLASDIEVEHTYLAGPSLGHPLPSAAALAWRHQTFVAVEQHTCPLGPLVVDTCFQERP